MTVVSFHFIPFNLIHLNYINQKSLWNSFIHYDLKLIYFIIVNDICIKNKAVNRHGEKTYK